MKNRDEEIVGYAAAGEHLGMSRNTLSHYVNAGIGPKPLPERRIVGGHALRVFLRSELDRWKNSGRVGRGARTDLVSDTHIKGYAAAARHLGLSTARLQTAVNLGTGPRVTWERLPRGKRSWPKFAIKDLNAWKAETQRAT